jgi:hypothetical protein
MTVPRGGAFSGRSRSTLAAWWLLAPSLRRRLIRCALRGQYRAHDQVHDPDSDPVGLWREAEQRGTLLA